MSFFFCLNYYGIDFTKKFWASKFRECLLLHNLEHGFQSAASGLYVAHCIIQPMATCVNCVYEVVPLQARRGPVGSRKLRFPDFVTTALDGGRLSALRTSCLYP